MAQPLVAAPVPVNAIKARHLNHWAILGEGYAKLNPVGQRALLNGAWALQDGYGARGAGQWDWSGIRDSSDEAAADIAAFVISTFTRAGIDIAPPEDAYTGANVGGTYRIAHGSTDASAPIIGANPLDALCGWAETQTAGKAWLDDAREDYYAVDPGGAVRTDTEGVQAIVAAWWAKRPADLRPWVLA